jgi:hypothetical protein
MASVETTIVPCEKPLDFTEGKLKPFPNEEPLFHFGLRQLFTFVAAICAVLAAVVSSPGLLGMVILIASTVVSMHIFATTIGHRLQSRTEKERRLKPAQLSDDWIELIPQRSAKLAAIRSAPRSPWHDRGTTYLPWLPRLVMAAITLGGISGALLLGGLIGNRTSLPGILVGSVSFAVLAGWISFLGGNFFGVFRHGFQDALAERHDDPSNHGA